MVPGKDIEDQFTSAVKLALNSQDGNSRSVSGNLAAQRAHDPESEVAISSKRTRMWRVAVLGAALAAIVATLSIFITFDRRGNLADELARDVRLRSKVGSAHVVANMSPLSGVDFAHRETARAVVKTSAPQAKASASSESTGGLSTSAVKVTTNAASGASNGITHGNTNAIPSASSFTGSIVSASSSHLTIQNPNRAPAPALPDQVVPPAENEKTVAVLSAAPVFPSTQLKVTGSGAGHRTHASPQPVEPKVPRLANREIPSPLVKQSTVIVPAIAESQQQRGSTAVPAPAPANAQDERMPINAGSEVLGTVDRPTSESQGPIASVVLGAAGATLGIEGALVAQIMPDVPSPNQISHSSSEAVMDLSSFELDSDSQEAEASIPVGTKITAANWKQYQAFMPDGMIALFSGAYGLKMPTDVEIDVGQSIHILAPGTFRQASEKYSGRVRVVHLPNGRNDIANYVAGEPFPVPQGPDKGYEILADLWYTYSPHLAVGMPGGGPWNVTMLDRFGNATNASWAFVYRQLAFNTDPGVPRTDPNSPGAFYTQWLMTEEPEQAKYMTDLDILPQNPQQSELNYIFLPALRHPMNISVSSRCAPLLGTDWTHDDQKPGFNGGLANFDADYLKTMKVLALVNLSGAVADFPREYDMPLGFARPSWGNWSLRDSWVINIHRIPSETAGYCYAKRIEYIDRETARSLWEDLYDSNRQLWKVTMSAYYPRTVPGTNGETIYGRFAAATWDLQNQHATIGNSTDQNGRLIMFNTEVPGAFDNVAEYSTPGGLMQIMR